MLDENVRPRLSVIITNYNYARFVGTAIQSLKEQPIPIEIIVVDDCSSDDSRKVLASYGEGTTIILKDKNLGHGDGFNQGFAASTGEIILFLDADDFMLPGAAQVLLDTFDAKSALNVYRMRYADAEGRTFGMFPPLEAPLTHGPATDILLERGSIRTTVTSGMVYPRWALEAAMPVPIEDFRQGADGYLASIVPLYGPIAVHDIEITAYRQHTTQHSKFMRVYAERARWCLAHHEARYRAIRTHSGKLGKVCRSDFENSDIDNLQQRLISLIFEPDLHPFPSDDPKMLITQVIRLERKYASRPIDSLKILWWKLLLVANEGIRKVMISWQVDPLTRPDWLNSLGRLMRTRLKLMP
jgi:glycosyltransferase involved in cell wall biosynthesis